jgi:tetratricopeptide (TPR) repeat protein
MTITFSRPGVKGRPIWGALVPYDKVWRTGANEATVITFSDDVTINGQALPKGTYMLATVPGQDSWTIIFNKVADQWGAFSYDQTKDVLRVTAKPEKAPFTEWMTFDVPQVSWDNATVALRWENVAVPFTVGSNTIAKTLAAAKSAVAAAPATDWRTALRAASFAFDTGNLTDAQAWLDQAIKANENISTLWLKARLLQKRGQIADAIRTGEMAIAKAGKDDQDFASEIRKTVDSWKK